MNKVQKIREGVERLKSQLLRGACSSQIAMETICKEEAYNEVLAILDTMQEEPKRCMYSKDNYTEEDRKVLCEGCEEKCEFNQVKESAILQHKEDMCKERGNSLTNEPVSVWHRGDEFKDIEYQRICKKVIGNMENKRFAIGDVMEVENGAIDLLYEDGCVAMCIRKEDTWAYLDDLLNLSNVQKITKNWKEPLSDDLEEAANNALNNVLNAHEIVNVRSCLEMFKSGANWQKKRDYIPLSDDINEVAKQICNKVLNCEIDYMEDDVVLSDEEECVKAGIRWQMQKESIPSKDLLEELINNLSKRYPEVSFAKLSRIAVRVAKWKEEQMMSKAVDAHVNYAWSGLSFGGFDWSKTGLDIGDKCKLIIIKED